MMHLNAHPSDKQESHAEVTVYQHKLLGNSKASIDDTDLLYNG